MKLVIFGLTVSSSWGNGHATLWRGLIDALAARGHEVVFFERDQPFYAAHRDMPELPGARLVLYPDWRSVAAAADRELAGADVGMVTSYCPDALEAASLVCGGAGPLGVFYDLDTPVTLARLAAGEPVGYVGPRGLADYDLVLSYTGGGALEALTRELGARRVAPLYGSVDPAVHHVGDLAMKLVRIGRGIADVDVVRCAPPRHPVRVDPRGCACVQKGTQPYF